MRRSIILDNYQDARNRVIPSNLDGYIFIVLDMDKFSSTAYNFTKDNEFISYYSKYTSRGTVIVPELFDKLKK